jgi:hypothetical protein
MNRRLSALLATGGTVALTLALGTSPSLATAVDSSYTATPGGTITATSSNVLLADVRTPPGKQIICNSSSISVTLPGDGIPHAGSGFGTITSVSFSKCGLSTSADDFTATTSALPWSLNIASFNTVQDVVHGSVTGIDMTLSRVNPLCTMTLDGTAAGAHNGYVKYSYDDKTAKITFGKTGGGLFLYNVSGCGTGFANNDPMAIIGVYTVSPPQDIT